MIILKIDIWLLLSIIFLSIFGIVMIYSSSNIWALYKFGDAYKFLKAQALFFIVGLFLIFILVKLDIFLFQKYSNKILLLSFILLVLVLIPGIGVVRNGSRSWFGFGGIGVQPSEFAKLALIIFSSKYLEKTEKGIKKIKNIVPLLIVILLFFFLIMLEPDFGTGFVIVLTLICLIFISGPDISIFIKLGIAGILGIVGLIMIAPYRLKRIVAYLNPWSDPLGSGFQIIQSIFAISPSGLFGTGFGNSIQKHFYLPEPQTDFIFSIICEEFGFLGCLVVILVFAFIFYRCIRISLRQNNLFLKYLSFGLSFGIIFQVLLNLMVVSGLIPTTGVTLPFLSYGGSSLLITLCSMGIILNISRYQR